MGQRQKKRVGHRRVEVSVEDVRKEKVTRWRTGGKNREEEEEELDGSAASVSAASLGEKGLIESAISRCRIC